jgi:hypothetical protein
MSQIIEFPRAHARPASQRNLPNYEAGLYSGITPDAAPGGSRHHSKHTSSRSSGASQPNSALEDSGDGFWLTVAIMLFAGVATVGALTLVLL